MSDLHRWYSAQISQSEESDGCQDFLQAIWADPEVESSPAKAELASTPTLPVATPVATPLATPSSNSAILRVDPQPARQRATNTHSINYRLRQKVHEAAASRLQTWDRHGNLHFDLTRANRSLRFALLFRCVYRTGSNSSNEPRQNWRQSKHGKRSWRLTGCAC